MTDEPLNPIQAQHAIDNLKAKMKKAEKALMEIQRAAPIGGYISTTAKNALFEMSKMP